MPPAIMPSVDSANMPPNSHDVGFCAPITTMKPSDPSTMTAGISFWARPAGTGLPGSGGGSSGSSPPGSRGDAPLGTRRTVRVLMGGRLLYGHLDDAVRLTRFDCAAG